MRSVQQHGSSKQRLSGCQHVSEVVVPQQLQSRGARVLAWAVQHHDQQHHEMFHDHEPMHQHQQHIPPPEWHPRLFGLKDTKRAALEQAARLYYEEVWNAGSLDLLDELADAGVCFNDALGMEADAFSRSSLKTIIQDFQSSHPLLKYDLVSHQLAAAYVR